MQGCCIKSLKLKSWKRNLLSLFEVHEGVVLVVTNSLLRGLFQKSSCPSQRRLPGIEASARSSYYEGLDHEGK